MQNPGYRSHRRSAQSAYVRIFATLAVVGLGWIGTASIVPGQVRKPRGGVPPSIQAERDRREAASIKGDLANRWDIDISAEPRPPIEFLRALKVTGGTRQAVFGPSGGWAITAVERAFVSGGLPTEMGGYLAGAFNARKLAFTSDGRGCFVEYDMNTCKYAARNLDPELLDVLSKLYSGEQANPGEGCCQFAYCVFCVAFSPQGGEVVIYDQHKPNSGDKRFWSYWSKGDFPATFLETLESARKNQEPIKQVVFPPTGGWLMILGDNDIRFEAIPPSLRDELRCVKQWGKRIGSVSVASNGAWVVCRTEIGFGSYDARPCA